MNAINTKPLVIRDEVHGDIVFDDLARRVIDHRFFQRLRYIKQVGLAEYVFPCATHTRFQHSLGAAYLASQYFDRVIQEWQHDPIGFDGSFHSTQFKTKKTQAIILQIVEDGPSLAFWRSVAVLAALLHDVGHGPWSHTFENLPLKQDYSSIVAKIPSPIREYLEDVQASKGGLHHEHLTLIYLHEIFGSLASDEDAVSTLDYFIPVATLIHQPLLKSSYKKIILDQIEATLLKHELKGGIDFLHLLRPLISGPFDVDRIDYIQRDGRNCGVSLGGIEWRRIVGRLLPCLAEHPNSKGEPEEVVLISRLNNLHVLDDFVFSLFQMYAQVYLHPKIVGFEEIIRKEISKKQSTLNLPTITFARHSTLTDDQFRQWLTTDFGLKDIEELLGRSSSLAFHATRVAPSVQATERMQSKGYEFVDIKDRPMMKDSVGLFIYSTLRDASGNDHDYDIQPWTEISPMAEQFFSIRYAPHIWIRINSAVG